MLTRDLDTLLHALDACQDAGPQVERALPKGGRVQIALAHLLAAAAEVQAALDWRTEGDNAGALPSADARSIVR